MREMGGLVAMDRELPVVVDLSSNSK